MKILVLFATLVVALMMSFPSWSVSEGKVLIHGYQNNETLVNEHVIYSADPLYFCIDNPDIDAKWKVEILKASGDYEEMPVYIWDSSECEVKFDDVAWRDACRIFDESLFRFLFKIRVSVALGGHDFDYMELYLAFLPTIPLIRDVNFVYDYDFELDEICLDTSLFSFHVDCDDDDSLYMGVSYANLFEEPHFISWIVKANEEHPHYFEYDADWGEYVVVIANNEFGSVYSQKICTTDYIYDKEVLDRLSYLKELADINVLEDDLTSFENNVLSFSCPAELVQVIDTYGHVMMICKNQHEVDLSGLNQGVYIVTISNNSNIKQLKLKVK